MLEINKFFTDNEHYLEISPVADALVDAIGDMFIATDNLPNGRNYRLPQNVDTPKFMSCIALFIKVGGFKHPKRDITDYVNSMKCGKDSFDLLLSNEVKLETMPNRLVFSKMIDEFVELVLWTCYIHYLIMAEVGIDEKKNRNIAFMFLDCFQEHTGMSDNEFSRHFLVGQSIPTVKKGVKYYKHNENNDDTGVPALNCTYVADNDKIKELQQKNTDLEAENNSLKEMIELYESLEKIDLKGHDTVRIELILSLLCSSGFDLNKRGNKAKAAKFISVILGNSPISCKNYITDRHLDWNAHGELIEKFNFQLHGMGIDIKLKVDNK